MPTGSCADAPMSAEDAKRPNRNAESVTFKRRR
jgi:hypothetical protein